MVSQEGIAGGGYGRRPAEKPPGPQICGEGFRVAAAFAFASTAVLECVPRSEAPIILSLKASE